MTDAASPVTSEPIEIDSEAQLLQALRARRESLQLSYESLSAVSGIPEQYPSRLLSGARSMGMLSLFVMIQTLGLKIVLVADKAALEKNRRHSEWQILKRPRQSRIIDPDRTCQRDPEWIADQKALQRMRGRRVQLHQARAKQPSRAADWQGRP
jgi:hypothetical protein